MLVEKYRPRKTGELAGQAQAVAEFLKWLDNWKPGAKAALLHGPTGSGKSSLVEAVAGERNIELVQMNASDSRTADAVERMLGSAVRQRSLFNRNKIIFIDELDGIAAGDRGGMGSVLKIAAESKFPVVLATNDLWDQKMRPVRDACLLIPFKKVNSISMAKRLQEIARAENINVPPETLRMIAQRAAGDMRSALNDLEALLHNPKGAIEVTGQRERGMSVFDCLKVIFKTQSASSAIEAAEAADKDADELFWWIESNISAEYQKPDEVARAFDALSVSDVFRSRIARGQNWRMRRYATEMMSAGVALSKARRYNSFVMYKPPQRLALMGRTKQRRMMRDAAAGKIGAALHASRRTVNAACLPFLRIVFARRPDIATDMGLTREELEYLTKT